MIVILLQVDTVEEITELVAKNLPEKSPLADGDLLVVTVQGSCGRDFVIASFHGRFGERGLIQKKRMKRLVPIQVTLTAWQPYQ